MPRSIVLAAIFGAFAAFAVQPSLVRAQTAPAASSAGANLNITPRRVVFDPKTRTATVYIFNQGETTASFDIRLVDRVMLPNGEIRAADDAGTSAEASAVVANLRTAHEMVVAAPRRVTLAPGRGQAIRLRASLPSDGDAAEYRTHLTVANLPPPDAGLTAEEAADPQPGRLSFQVHSLFGISIPVIIRTAVPDVRAALSDVRLAEIAAHDAANGAPKTVPALELEIQRLGANSLFGNIEVRGGRSGSELLGTARGVGVYPEIAQRSLSVPLQRAPASGEELVITFTDDDVAPGSELARTAFVAP